MSVGQDIAAVRTKLNQTLGGRDFPWSSGDQCRRDDGHLSGVTTSKTRVSNLGAVLESETDISNEQALGLDFLDVSPLDRSNAFFPASISLDRKKQDALVGDNDCAGREGRRPPSGRDLLDKRKRASGTHYGQNCFPRQQRTLQCRLEFL